MPEQLITRQLALVRALTEDDAREVEGIGVPWNQDAEVWDPWMVEPTIERFAPGSVEVHPDAMLYWNHEAPIGPLIEHSNTDAGWEYRAGISRTVRGDEAYTLARDGVVKHSSIGFVPISHVVEEDGSITRTKVLVREVSLAPMPAYDGADLTGVRNRSTQPREDHTMPENETPTRADLDAVATSQRNAFEDFEREIRTAVARGGNATPEPVDTRSLGQVLKAIVAGDEDTIRAYNDLRTRAFEGTVVADDGITRPGWVGDLSRLVETPDRLSGLFATGTLPQQGMTLEYGQLKSNTVKVEEQAEEGDPLVFGKVETETKSAPVVTLGGWTALSRQAIERSSANVLDMHIRALGLAARKAKTLRMRSAFGAAVAREKAAGNTVSAGTGDDYLDWVSAIIDAAEKYEDNGLTLDGLVPSKSVFKQLSRLTATDGRPLMTVYGSGTNVVGEIDAKALDGVLANVLVRPNLKQQTPGASFVTRDAIRVYDSPIASLSDENIVELTKQFSVYLYSAIAHEIPFGIVPIQFAAAPVTP